VAAGSGSSKGWHQQGVWHQQLKEWQNRGVAAEPRSGSSKGWHQQGMASARSGSKRRREQGVAAASRVATAQELEGRSRVVSSSKGWQQQARQGFRMDDISSGLAPARHKAGKGWSEH
jgi:hypothetical protein